MTRQSDCGICQGGGFIRLRNMPRLVLAPSSLEKNVSVSPSYELKEYPCPECSPKTTADKIDILEYGCEISLRYFEADNHNYVRHARERAAHDLVQAILDSGHIRFEMREKEKSVSLDTIPLRAMLGVVSKTHVASIEDRAKIHNKAFAEEVIADAQKQIANWNSETAAPEWIRKINVSIELEEALKRVIEKHKAVKEIE